MQFRRRGPSPSEACSSGPEITLVSNARFWHATSLGGLYARYPSSHSRRPTFGRFPPNYDVRPRRVGAPGLGQGHSAMHWRYITSLCCTNNRTRGCQARPSDSPSALLHKSAQRLCTCSVQQRVKLHIAAHAGSEPIAIGFAQCSDARRTVFVANFAIIVSASIVETGPADLGQMSSPFGCRRSLGRRGSVRSLLVSTSLLLHLCQTVPGAPGVFRHHCGERLPRLLSRPLRLFESISPRAVGDQVVFRRRQLVDLARIRADRVRKTFVRHVAVKGVVTLTGHGARKAIPAGTNGLGGDAGNGLPLRHGVEAMKMGGKGGATGTGRDEEIADGGEDGDEPL